MNPSGKPNRNVSTDGPQALFLPIRIQAGRRVGIVYEIWIVYVSRLIASAIANPQMDILVIHREH